MIPRYSRPKMVDIWSPSTKFRIWYEIEAHACDAMAEIGLMKHPARTASAGRECLKQATIIARPLPPPPP